MNDKNGDPVYTCPECGMDWKYEVDGETHRHLIGIEDRDRYDGISFWMCPKCETMWDRFTGEVYKHDKS